MSNKARRRPSWKVHKKTGDDQFILHLINEETNRLMEIIRIPKKGHVGRSLIARYGREGAEEKLKQLFINAANETIRTKEYLNAKADQKV